MGIFDFLRSDVTVDELTQDDRVSEALDHAEDEIEKLKEASVYDEAARRTLARRVEDLTWQLVGAKVEDETPEDRRRTARRAYRYWAEDPVIGNAIDLLTRYTFGRGVPKPAVVKSNDLTDELRTRAEGAITAFWEAPENKATLTGIQAQQEKSVELQCEGEVFLVMFDGPGSDENGGVEGESSLLLGAIDPAEITQVITKAENQSIALFYERRWMEREYDFTNKTWVSGKSRVAYYRHYENVPEEGDPVPPRELLRDGVVMHVTVNKTSRQQRGNSELRRVVQWARGFHEYMEGRLAVTRAINRIAQKVRVDGGPTEVQNIMKQIASADSMGMSRTPQQDLRYAPPMGSTIFHSPAVSIDPMSFETGGGTAAADKTAFLSMIASGTGWPPHYLGGEGSQSLANLTAMEAPALKMCEERQELWEQVFSFATREALRRAGMADVEVEVKMPPILSRDITQITGAIAATVQTVDPTFQNVPLKRWALAEVMSAFGEASVGDRVNEIIPEDYEEPSSPEVIAQQQMSAAVGMAQQQKNLDRADPSAPPGVRTVNGQRQAIARNPSTGSV